MDLKTGSASAFQRWLDCPASWAAYYATGEEGRTPDLSGSPAMLGTACHLALEWWVDDEHHSKPYTSDERDGAMRGLFHTAYWETFPAGDRSRYDEGLQLCLDWVDRQNWAGRTVIGAELRGEFMLTTSQGEVPVRYVIDRLDRLDDGTIEVIDYKSQVRNLPPDELHAKVQARVYALAAQIMYPDAPEIWVTMDLLRYDTSSTLFTKEENRETWHFLKGLAEDIINTGEPAETLNMGCRWCVRRHECEVLRKHRAVGGPIAIDDLKDAVQRRHETDLAIKALSANLGELDEFIIDEADRRELTEWTEESGVQVALRSRASRSVDAVKVSTFLGDDASLFVRTYGGMGVASIEKALKDEHSFLPLERRRALESLMERKHTSVKVTTKAGA